MDYCIKEKLGRVIINDKKHGQNISQMYADDNYKKVLKE